MLKRSDTATLRVTRFPNEQAFKLKALDLTLEELRELILKETAATKEALPWLELKTFGTKRSVHNSLRWNENVISICGVEIDYDEGNITFAEAIVLKRNRLHALVYTSPNNAAGKPRWRALLPTSRVLVVPDEQRAGFKHQFVARLNGLFGGTLCDASWPLSQAYYYGSVNNNPLHAAVIIPGDYIDERVDLDAGAIQKDDKLKPKDKQPGADDGIDDDDVNKWPG
ncbi:MAG: hypothetical protein ACLP19_16065 [Xanthobacteraceae bacterium]